MNTSKALNYQEIENAQAKEFKEQAHMAPVVEPEEHFAAQTEKLLKI